MAEKDVPYLVHENAMARLERSIEKWWVAFIVMFVLFISTNIFWIYYEFQYESVTITNEVDTGNGDATITGIGDITNGESETDDTN